MSGSVQSTTFHQYRSFEFLSSTKKLLHVYFRKYQENTNYFDFGRI